MADEIVLSEWDIQRFWRKVARTGFDDCWLWQGAHNGVGYGVFNQRFPRHRVILATHVSLALDGRPRPKVDACNALHGDCSNPACVNPRHLRWGSHAENAADRIRLVRHNAPKGAAHYRAKLTEEQVRAIAADSRVASTIAAEYGVSKPTVIQIKNRMIWKHLWKVE